MGYLLAAEESFDIKKVWNDIVTFFTTKYWNIILFFAILVIGIIVVKLLVKLIHGLLRRSRIEKIGQSFILNIAKYVLYLILILVLLAVIGVNLSGVLTAISAVILAVGMALQSYISNLASGMIIVSMHMINKGDFIAVGDVTGTVRDINFLFTTVNTTDNKKIMMPNSTLVNSPLTNYGVNGTRRVDFTFSAAYESDVEAVKKIVLSVMASYNKIKEDPAPFCRLKTLNTSSIDFFANCWCDSADYWDVYYYVTENVFNEFKRSGVAVPFTQTEVRIRNDEVKMPVEGDKLPDRQEYIRKPEVVRKSKSPIAKNIKKITTKISEGLSDKDDE
ncbi:MAG: mechanosensitive ion channel [Clostridia bacterium]|nr:mechanosensitive ion channel [Clostridia bacterium]